MDLAFISFKQVIIMLIMIILGFILVKLKLIDTESKKSLSNILVYLVVPLMIINSYNVTYDKTILTNLLLCFLFSFITLIISIIISDIVSIFIKSNDKPILKFAMMFSNAAYMGFPLIEAMFNKEGLIYASAYVSVFNILLWSVGYKNVNKSGSLKQTFISIMKTPVIYALIIGLIIFFFQIPIPDIISTPLSMIGSMNTPLSMIIIGMIIATCNIKNVLKNMYLWIVTITRLIIIPLITLLIIYLLSKTNVDPNILKICFILSCCPCAAITSVFAVKYNYDNDLSSAVIVITTILSIITLPLLTLFINVII